MPPSKRTTPSKRRTPAKRTTASKRTRSSERATATKAARPKARPAAPREETPFRDGPRGRDARHEEPPRAQPPPVSPFQPGFAPECMACPFGLVFFALKNTKPEVMEHVMRAGFEMFQALRAVMDSYGDRWDQAQQLQRIPIS